MTAQLLINPSQQFFNDNGNPLSGGFVNTYAAGTLSRKMTWSDASASTPNSNPIELDSAGRAVMYGSGSYKFILTDADGNQIGDVIDNVQVYSTPATSGNAFEEVLSGNGSQTIFTLSEPLGTDEKLLLVWVNNGTAFQILNTSQYTINGVTLTFATAPPNAANNIIIRVPNTDASAASASAAEAALSQIEAAGSAAAALVSENNAKTAETNAETAETNAEAAQAAAQLAQTSAEAARTAAEAAQAAAETAETNAETAQAAAELAASDATTAETNAEGYKNAAEAAKTAAEAAQSAAETAQANAETAETNAETAETNAAASAAAAAASAAQFQGTSTTSVTIGTGTKAFTTQSGKLFNGENVRVYSAANVANYMDGIATYSGTSLSVDVTVTGGSGTLTDWVIKVNGARGEQGPSGSITDGDKGDITVSGSGTTWTIDNSAVTLAKMQNIATDSLIGRDTAGSGAPENITLNATLSMTGTGALQRAALTGDVTASAGSNATTIANNAVTLAKLATQAANTILANATASTAVPTAVALSANQFLARSSSGNIAAKTVTDFGLSLIDDADATAAKTTLGVKELSTGTAVSASGTSVDFTSIPSGTKRITVVMSALSTSGTSPVTIRLGTGGTPQTSGYAGLSGWMATANANVNSETAGFTIFHASSASTYSRHGTITLHNISGNTWVAVGQVGLDATAYFSQVMGSVTLGGAIDIIRITTNSGTDTFDAGTLNVFYN